ncbi:hypothetical protein JAAARDRAFT_57218 [Jaapia argillacea MUCL 33604]|uniref:NACHT domain-containing protein n=1 Tax=Jaapia argillacea MUCL 33604 TaxID=933084 RepID=A0A067PWV0_9AGAM|nr:hypothetical protein JAAARDRAFT_57218 [Jaapia argillacea MUCL 33604]
MPSFSWLKRAREEQLLGRRSTNSSSKAKGAVLRATKLSVRLLRESLDGVPVPGLKGVLGGLYEVIDTIDRIKQNDADFNELAGYLDDLSARLQSYKQGDNIPPELESSLNKLAQELKPFSDTIVQKVSSRTLMGRIIDNSDDAQIIVDMIRKINGLLQNYHTDVLSNLAIGQHKLHNDLVETLNNSRQYILDTLPISTGALHNSAEREFTARSCLPKTRSAIILDILQWASDRNSPPVLWLSGLFGTGKSTIAQSIAELCEARQFLGASFFFSRDKHERRSTDLFFPTLARQLASHIVELNPYLAEALKRDSSLCSRNLETQCLRLIIEPLKALYGKTSGPSLPIVVVIDALDECENDAAVSRILGFVLSHSMAFIPPFLKFFITSRPEPHIVSVLQHPEHRAGLKAMPLGSVPVDTIHQDIRTYLNWGFKEIRDRRRDINLTAWPPGQAVETLVGRSGGLFIYASTILKFIGDEDENPGTQLNLALQLEGTTYPALYGKLDDLYRCVLSSSTRKDRLQLVLGTMATLFDSLSTACLEEIMDLGEGDVGLTLRRLHSVVLVPPNPTDVVTFFHPSFREYLTSKHRSGDNFIDTAEHHARLTLCCIRFITNTSRVSGTQDNTLHYACRHWASHLSCIRQAKAGEVLAQVKEFVVCHLEGWVTLMGSLGDLKHALAPLENACRWFQGLDEPPADVLARLCAYLNTLGTMNSHHFRRYGTTVALEGAIAAHNAAVCHAVDGDVDVVVYLHDLGIALQQRCQLLKQFPSYKSSAIIDDVDTAIAVHRQAMELSPKLGRGSEVEDAVLRCGLAMALRTDFSVSRDAKKLDEAIVLLNRCVELVPDLHPTKSPCLNILGTSLRLRSSLRDDTTLRIADLTSSVDAHRAAVANTTVLHLWRAVYLSNLGDALLDHSQLLPDVAHDAAMDCFSEVISSATASPSIRFGAAAKLALGSTTLMAGSLDVHRAAMDYLSQISWSAFDPTSRTTLMLEAWNSISLAAECAISMDKSGLALQWLEQGMTIFWGEKLQMKVSCEQGLFQKLEEVGRELEAHRFAEPIPLLLSTLPPEEVHLELIVEWDRLVTEIRGLPGLSQYRAPKVFSQLVPACSNGAVVVLHAGPSSCHALVLSKSTTLSDPPLLTLKLPLSAAELQDLGVAVDALSGFNYFSPETVHRARTKQSEKEDYGQDARLKLVLHRIWLSIVSPILQALALKVCGIYRTSTWFSHLSIALGSTTPSLVVSYRAISSPSLTCGHLV